MYLRPSTSETAISLYCLMFRQLKPVLNNLGRKMSSISEVYDFVLDLTVKIGDVMKEGFNSKLHIETKEATYDVVTEYDRRVENFLMENISKKYPNHK